MSQTREAIGSASSLAAQIKSGTLNTVDDVRGAIKELNHSTGITPWLAYGLAKENLRSLGGSNEQLQLLDDAIKEFSS